MGKQKVYKTPLNYREELIFSFLEKGKNSFSDSNALFIGGRYYSYVDLWKKVLSVYDLLSKSGKYKAIGIYCTDDVYTYASILAVNLYGAAYVPLNSKFPVQRNQNIIDTCELNLVLAKDKSCVSALMANFVYTEVSELHAIKKYTNYTYSDFKIVRQPIAYMLFTSGSTGIPKGVPVTDANANSFFSYYLKNYDFTSDDRFLQVYELTFDVSVFSFFMPLLVGACCYVLPNEGLKFLKTIDYLKKHSITVVSMVPTVLGYLEKYFSQITLPDLRYSFFSGDALKHELAVKWSHSVPNAQIHNFYGPTETTIVCTRFVFDKTSSEQESVNGIVPLGVPFDGMEILIVDEENKPVVKGELCFSGSQVIPMYLNATNEEQFFYHNNKRFYKTGDIVSVNSNANLVFHGRTDSQVKVNGFRIELVEVENALISLLNTKVVVLKMLTSNGGNQLVTFVEDIKVDEKKCKEDLLELLPEYMIPSKIVGVAEFALTENGKVDKKALLKFV